MSGIVDKALAEYGKFIYLDIDRSYFIKPLSHFIYYRHSASGRHFHLKFKRDWLSNAEFFNLLMQCDQAFLCHQIVQKKFKVARKKKEKKVGEWKETSVPYSIYILMACGSQVTKGIVHGFSYLPLETKFFREIEEKEDWITETLGEMEKLAKVLPKEIIVVGSGLFENDYDDYDDGEDLYDEALEDYYGSEDEYEPDDEPDFGEETPINELGELD